MKQIVDGAVFLFDMMTLPLLYGMAFERRVRFLVFLSGIAALGMLWYTALVSIPLPNIWFKLPINLLWSLAILSFFRGPLLHRISIALIYQIVHAGIDVFFYGIMTSLSHVTMQEILSDVNLSSFYGVLGHMILFGVCFYLGKMLQRRKYKVRMSIWEWLPVLLIISFNTVQLYIAMYTLSDDQALVSIFPIQAVLLLFSNVVLLMLLDRLSSQNRLAQENLTLQEQMRYNRMNLQAAAENYETQRSITHDFDNRLLVIVQLLQAGKLKDALDYTQNIQVRVKETNIAVSTNNPIVDAVLNQKYRQAKEKGIGIQFLVNDLSQFPLSADEMVMVLANLLDNAMEACERHKTEESEEVRIRVKLLMEDSFATLSVQNCSLPVVISQEGQITTSKENQLEHGFGMKKCQKILKNSGFEYAVQYKDGWFLFAAMKTL